MPSILFVCVHNACRSQIAEAIFRKLAPDSWVIASAGSKPSTQVDPKAVQILKQHQLAMNSNKPRGLSDLSVKEWDFVVGIGCGDLRSFVSAKKYIEWSIPDPEDGPMTLYESLFQGLNHRICKLIEEIQGETPP